MTHESSRAPKRQTGSRGNSNEGAVAQILESERLISDRDGRVFRYNGRYWEKLTPLELSKVIYAVVPRYALTSTQRKEVGELLKITVCKNDLQWGRVAEDEIACKSSVLNLETGDVRPHRPDDYLKSGFLHTTSTATHTRLPSTGPLKLGFGR